jgi:hypothetical protein
LRRDPTRKHQPNYLMAASFSASLLLPCTSFFIFRPNDSFRCLLFSFSFPLAASSLSGAASLCPWLAAFHLCPVDVSLRFRPFFKCHKLLFRACKGKIVIWSARDLHRKLRRPAVIPQWSQDLLNLYASAFLPMHSLPLAPDHAKSSRHVTTSLYRPSSHLAPCFHS